MPYFVRVDGKNQEAASRGEAADMFEDARATANEVTVYWTDERMMSESVLPSDAKPIMTYKKK